jgi:MSHA biogenesis protein MshL
VQNQPLPLARRRLTAGVALVGLSLGVPASQAQPAPPPESLAVTQLEGVRSRGAAPLPPAGAGSQPARQPPPQPLPPYPVLQLDERRRVDDLDAVRPFSLRFAEPLPIRDLLLLLVRDTSFSIVPDPDIEGTFIGELKDVTLQQALELILHPLGLDYSVDHTFIRVFRHRTDTRLFDVNYVTTRRAGRRSLSSATAATAGGVALVAHQLAPDGAGTDAIGGSSSSLVGEEAGDIFQELAAGLVTLLSPEGRFNLDRKAALLQVSDFPERLDRIGLYLEAVQMRVHRQVQIEARVIEVELREEFAAGIDWHLALSTARTGLTVTQDLAPAAAGGVTVGIRLGDFDALLRAFAAQGRVNVLSSPRVVAMNNEPALMRIGTQDVFFITTSQVDAVSGRVLQTTVAPQAITEGVVLGVTPQISADGFIHMNIVPSVTERTGEAISRLGDVVPILSVREADTLVRVQEGETIVLGGLMQEIERSHTARVPVLGDLPVLGGLFRREARRRTKTDLVILLTPTVLTPGQIAATAASEQERLDRALEPIRR